MYHRRRCSSTTFCVVSTNTHLCVVALLQACELRVPPLAQRTNRSTSTFARSPTSARNSWQLGRTETFAPVNFTGRRHLHLASRVRSSSLTNNFARDRQVHNGNFC